VSNIRTAVSLPEELVEALAVLARTSGKTRSAIVADAIESYVRRLQSEGQPGLDVGVRDGSEDERALGAWRVAAAQALFGILDEEDGGWPQAGSGRPG
jgi:predicted transcriptional regulator